MTYEEPAKIIAHRRLCDGVGGGTGGASAGAARPCPTTTARAMRLLQTKKGVVECHASTTPCLRSAPLAVGPHALRSYGQGIGQTVEYGVN